MKSKTLKQILATTVLTSTLLITSAGISNAALQANGSRGTTKALNEWPLEIRKMQEMGGTLGRNDTINTTNLTSNATDLDIHMQKNTEYGAMAILSASAYGNPSKIASGKTTTGNASGIVININKEWVAAKTNASTNFGYNTKRYVDFYAFEYKSKIGDAVGETNGWHGGGAIWLQNVSNGAKQQSGLLRATSGSLFSYQGGIDLSDAGDANYTKPWYTRAVIVVGTGV